jgi:hypothetical protein
MFILSGYTMAFIFPKKAKTAEDTAPTAPQVLIGHGLPSGDSDDCEPALDVAMPQSEVSPPFQLHRYF